MAPSSVATAVPHAFTVTEPKLATPYAFLFDPGQYVTGENIGSRRRVPTLLAAVHSDRPGQRIVELNLRGHIRVVAGPGARGEAGLLENFSGQPISMFANGDLLVIAEYNAWANSSPSASELFHPFRPPIFRGIFRVNRSNGTSNTLVRIGTTTADGQQLNGFDSVFVDPVEKDSFFFADRMNRRIYKAKTEDNGDLQIKTVIGGGQGEPTAIEQPGTNILLSTPRFQLSVDRHGKMLVTSPQDNWVAELNRNEQITLIKQYHVPVDPHLGSAIRLANNDSIAVSLWMPGPRGQGIELIKPDGTTEWLVDPSSQSQANAIPASQLKLHYGIASILHPTPDGGILVNDISTDHQQTTRYIEPRDRTDEQRAQLAQLNPERAANKLIRTRKAVLSLAHDRWVQGTPLQRLPRDVRQIIGEYALTGHHEQWWKTLIARWIPRAG